MRNCSQTRNKLAAALEPKTHWVNQGYSQKKFQGGLYFGVSVNVERIFMHLFALVTGTDSQRDLKLENHPLNMPMGSTTEASHKGKSMHM